MAAPDLVNLDCSPDRVVQSNTPGTHQEPSRQTIAVGSDAPVRDAPPGMNRSDQTSAEVMA